MYSVKHGSCFSIWIDFDLHIRRDFLKNFISILRLDYIKHFEHYAEIIPQLCHTFCVLTLNF